MSVHRGQTQTLKNVKLEIRYNVNIGLRIYVSRFNHTTVNLLYLFTLKLEAYLIYDT